MIDWGIQKKVLYHLGCAAPLMVSSIPKPGNLLHIPAPQAFGLRTRLGDWPPSCRRCHVDVPEQIVDACLLGGVRLYREDV